VRITGRRVHLQNRRARFAHAIAILVIKAKHAVAVRHIKMPNVGGARLRRAFPAVLPEGEIQRIVRAVGEGGDSAGFAVPIGVLEKLHTVEFRAGIICGWEMSVRLDHEKSSAPVNGQANGSDDVRPERSALFRAVVR
jgi:hypothetical protein